MTLTPGQVANYSWSAINGVGALNAVGTYSVSSTDAVPISACREFLGTLLTWSDIKSVNGSSADTIRLCQEKLSYVMTYAVTDSAGHSASASVTVNIPGDPRPGSNGWIGQQLVLNGQNLNFEQLNSSGNSTWSYFFFTGNLGIAPTGTTDYSPYMSSQEVSLGGVFSSDLFALNDPLSARVDLVAIGTDNQVYTGGMDLNSFSGWNPIGGSIQRLYNFRTTLTRIGTTTPIQSLNSISVANDANSVYVAATNTDGTAEYYTASQGWNSLGIPSYNGQTMQIQSAPLVSVVNQTVSFYVVTPPVPGVSVGAPHAVFVRTLNSGWTLTTTFPMQ